MSTAAATTFFLDETATGKHKLVLMENL